MASPLQSVYDAIQKARIEGEAWVTFRGERLKLIPFDENENKDGVSGRAFVRGRVKGGVAYATVWWHDGKLHIEHIWPNKAFRRARDSDIIVMVSEYHSREKN